MLGFVEDKGPKLILADQIAGGTIEIIAPPFAEREGNPGSISDKEPPGPTGQQGKGAVADTRYRKPLCRSSEVNRRPALRRY
mgnify:CR=1 FL=1